MADLVYSSIMSLDGYVADKDGNFDWGMPDDEVHGFFNDLERGVDTYLYGRRMYEVMVVWETAETFVGDSAVMQDYADIWQVADKIVYSRSLDSVSSAKTRIEREFDPSSIRELKASADSNISIGGPELASHAIRAGLVDEFRFVVAPIIIGGGNPVFPADVRVDLELVDERRFAGGMFSVSYRVKSSVGA
ncbi:MAG: dihydrofolate reductase family protein [Candidatus Nanopelagicales bacterium]